MITKKAFLLSLFVSFGINAAIPKETTDISSLSLSTHEHEDNRDIMKIDVSQTIAYERQLEKNKQFFYGMLFYSAFCKNMLSSIAKLVIRSSLNEQKNAEAFYAFLFKLCSLTRKALPFIGVIPFIQNKMWDKRIILDKRIAFSYIKGWLAGLGTSIIANTIIKSLPTANPLLFSRNGHTL